jgi:mono/diheme cytochrome c family protein
MTRSAWVVTIGCTWLVLLSTVVGGARQNPDGSDGWRIPESAATEQSPVPVSPATLARGKSLYQSKCQRCHGPDGAGRGPDADPAHAPADLTDVRRASRNPDGVMFYKIWNGRARPRMPAMKSDVSVTDAWMIVHYVKTLRKPALPPENHAGAR